MNEDIKECRRLIYLFYIILLSALIILFFVIFNLLANAEEELEYQRELNDLLCKLSNTQREIILWQHNLLRETYEDFDYDLSLDKLEWCEE